jgi:hypothetical protein
VFDVAPGIRLLPSRVVEAIAAAAVNDDNVGLLPGKIPEADVVHRLAL